MNEATLPPSPNWFLSTALACANDGTVAWGARNCLVIARPQPNSKVPKYSLITNVHPEKVVSVAFSPEFGSKEKNFIVSGGDEHIVRIWDLDTMLAVSAQSFHDVRISNWSIHQLIS